MTKTEEEACRPLSACCYLHLAWQRSALCGLGYENRDGCGHREEEIERNESVNRKREENDGEESENGERKKISGEGNESENGAAKIASRKTQREQRKQAENGGYHEQIA